ncbi:MULTISPECIES: glycosyltransferase family 4 protein [Sphingomonas]|jgi:glycosyltransferase involved in cell wall biosynthesis|uniref:Glycosyltransferase family 1 protein n=1 Tax=Sphingomonas adhaesiva TaxID=28212 RepID=A0A2A4I7Y7_9SPHN|nr:MULTISPECIES: glycosyltransferase family 1 protein [Sphingomonas]PCG13902.1 glycosyltransferase family 1 protein [Sphingomonas adhaesiva]PZU76741.1 MAG: glycosyltransferase family 1 protein [Sphingomonas sp.]
MRIAIVTDAWAPQVNGVVRTLESVIAELRAQGHEILVVSPAGVRSVPCPTYPEIRLALMTPAAIGRRIAAFGAQAVHIATEGPLGVAARRWCLSRHLPFTTAYHTQFPEYVAARTGADPEWIWRYVRWFHAPAAAILASTPTIEGALRDHGLPRVRRWGRGVAPVFSPDGARLPAMQGLAGPVLLHVGRVAVEKNIAAFLSADVPGTKVVVGDGPARAALQRQFPDAIFLGALFADDLAAAYRSADALVFPSRTDTFGLVMIEALACGTPVAAYPVPGPLDVLTPDTGVMNADLPAAIAGALALDRDTCAAAGARFTWAASARQFLDALEPFGSALARAA